jgi:hypothetical protein
MDTTEGEWGIFEDCWARYKRMTGMVDMEGIRDELRECCTKQLNTHLVQMHGLGALGSCDEAQLLGFIKAIAVRGVHKEVHRAAFQGMHQQQGELYLPYAARLKAKAELCQYGLKAPMCCDDLCNCAGHNRELFYRDKMVGTQLVAGEFNKVLN